MARTVEWSRVVTTHKGPAQLAPLLYLGTAHVALAAACVFAGMSPQSVAGFFYHAWLIGLVHLVTLGWITFSILGAIYVSVRWRCGWSSRRTG